MNRYYIFLQEGKDSKISTTIKRWEAKFEKYQDILGFILEDVFQSGNAVDNLINLAREKRTSFDNVYEIVFLPLILEPENLIEKLLQLKQIQIDLISRITSDKLDNAFLFPLIKITKEKLISLERESFKKILNLINNEDSNKGIVTTRFLSFFLFQDERISLTPYDNENWLSDIENFITVLPTIEDKGLHFFNYFPTVSESKIGTFVSDIYFSRKFEDISSYLNQSL
ncbi:MAG: hypothetical protein ACFFDI_16050, partial [Promethearchaeota archaeon]